MICLITYAVNQIEEFRINLNEKNEIGFWNYMSPCYALYYTIGKYIENDRKIIVSLAMQLHHATCDGFHAAQLI